MGKSTAFNKAKNVPTLPPRHSVSGMQRSWNMWGEKGALNQPHVNLKLSAIPQSITASISAVCHFFCC